MDFPRLVQVLVYAYLITSMVFGFRNVYVEIALYLVLLVSVVYAAEVTMALSNARVWYNVMVVSVAMALPQTVFAVNLAVNGKPTAAWIDTLASTLVDAVLVTAVIRRDIIGSPLIRSTVGYMLVWSILAVGLNLITGHGMVSRPITYAYAIIGLLLPLWLVIRTGISGLPDRSSIVLLANHAIATGLVSWELSNSLLSLEIAEVQLGVVSTILATLPDFIVGMLIRSVVSRVLSEEASMTEAVYTMLAAATHDQLTIPALILLFSPSAAAYYPHLFNIAVVLLKFTLLDKRVFYFIGLPASLLVLALPPV